MPVFFGFFLMIRSAIELRGAEFFWACDLSKADTIAFYPVPEFPAESAAARHGSDDALAGAPHARRPGHGPHAAEHHEVHAVDVPVHPLQLFGGLDALLDCAKLAFNSTNEADEGERGTESDRHSGQTGGPRAESTSEKEMTVAILTL
jgi:hypothetical protein